MTTATATHPHPIAGFTGFAMGSLALLVVLAHFWVGPFAPQQSVSVTVGEIAADIRQSALRKLKGLPPRKPVAEPWNFDRALKLMASLLAGLALVAGAASYIRQETWRPATAGAVLGASAILFQMFVWTILVLAGAIIIYAIIHNMSGILGE